MFAAYSSSLTVTLAALESLDEVLRNLETFRMALQIKRAAIVVIPVNTVVTNRFPSSRNLVATPPIRIPITVATLFSLIVFFT
jgi:hypothetical protein